MKKHYQVKVTALGRLRYGIADAHSAAAAAHATVGNVIVADATLPERFVVSESEVIDLPLDDPEYSAHVRHEYAKAVAADKAAGPGLAVGRLFTVGVGDGAAYYIVTKVNKKTVRIEWRSFDPDRYRNLHFGAGGSFPRGMVEVFVRSSDR